MLAQLSSQYSEASTALADMARQNQIPDSAWRAIAAGLAGNQYQFDRQLPQNTFPPGSSTEAGSSSIGGRSETFYSTPLAANGAIPDLSQLTWTEWIMRELSCLGLRSAQRTSPLFREEKTQSA